MKRSATHSSAKSPQEMAVYKAQLSMLVSHAPAGVWAGMAAGLVLMYLLWGLVSSTILFLWQLSYIVGSANHLFLLRHIKNKLAEDAEDAEDAEGKATLTYSRLFRFEQLLGGSFFIGGALLGIIGLLMEPTWPVSVLIAVPLFAAGSIAGLLGSTQGSFSGYFTFITPAMFMVAFGFAKIGMPLLSVFILVFYILMIVIGKITHERLMESFKLRINNLDLINDLTKNNKMQSELVEKLRKSEQLASGAFDSSGIAMALVDRDSCIFRVNQAACVLFGFLESDLLGRYFNNVSQLENNTDNIYLFKGLIKGESQKYQVKDRFLQGDGVSSIWVDATIAAVKDEQGQFDYAVVHIKDISQEHKLTEKLTYQAQHDSLTGLPNRYAFETKLQSLLNDANDDKHVLCYLDLDQFKLVNDTCGHIAGDELLKQLALLLKQELRRSDVLARIGGDEFAVLLLNCSIDSAVIHLEKVLLALREFRYVYEEHSFNVGASIGLVVIESNSSLTDVLKQADSACYAAKDAGRDRLHIYRQDDEVLAQRTGEMAWVSRIQQAIEYNQFVLYHQEIVQISGESNTPHFELLIRMIDDDGNVILPDAFLPAAERYNLAATIDLWVVKHTVNMLTSAIKDGKNIVGIYGVNLSGQSLGDTRFYEQIIQIILDNDLRGTGAIICFEVTETAAISNITAALRLMKELRELGCQFALDDFGSGLSSFAYLKQMPIDYLKIDGIFIKDCLVDPVNLEIIASINGIGQVMGLKTIAEYVENDDIFNKLAELGVDYAQGYWNGVPMPWTID